MKKTVAEWIANRPKTPEEYEAFRLAREEAKKISDLKLIEGKIISGAFWAEHSKSGDVYLNLDEDGGYLLHIYAVNNDIKVQLIKRIS